MALFLNHFPSPSPSPSSSSISIINMNGNGKFDWHMDRKKKNYFNRIDSLDWDRNRVPRICELSRRPRMELLGNESVGPWYPGRYVINPWDREKFIFLDADYDVDHVAFTDDEGEPDPDPNPNDKQLELLGDIDDDDREIYLKDDDEFTLDRSIWELYHNYCPKLCVLAMKKYNTKHNTSYCCSRIVRVSKQEDQNLFYLTFVAVVLDFSDCDFDSDSEFELDRLFGAKIFDQQLFGAKIFARKGGSRQVLACSPLVKATIPPPEDECDCDVCSYRLPKRSGKKDAASGVMDSSLVTSLAQNKEFVQALMGNSSFRLMIKDVVKELMLES